MRKVSSAIAAAAVLALAVPVEATDYYVSLPGRDEHDGLSPSTAWQTLAKVNTIDFRPGDRIFFEGGAIVSGELRLDANDADDAANPLVVTSYAAGRATIDGGGAGVLRL
ncbi:MAG TPA: hypothetical protein VNP04_08470 [Alphaproteobacteria bacterium]|nr:hypothetical protein [Alphaproteobacteria bacterium]